MDILQPTLLDAGLQAVFNAQNTGVDAVIHEIVIGNVGHTPQTTDVSLANQLQAAPVGGGEAEPRTIRVQAVFDGPQQFAVREVGFQLASGELLAKWSDPDRILGYKVADQLLLADYQLRLEPLPADSVTINVSGVWAINLVLLEELTRLSRAIVSLTADSTNFHDRLRALEEQA